MSSARRIFGLTQQQLATWLDVARSSIALGETGQRTPPLANKYWQRDLRLDLATLGKGLDPVTNAAIPGLPPLPPLPPAPEPLQARLHECRHRIRNLHYNLGILKDKARPYEARRAALPTLRAWTGSDPRPEQAASWLNLFEKEAEVELLYTCGPGPQRLLEARIAGLEHEAELLEEMLAALPPEPGGAAANGA